MAGSVTETPVDSVPVPHFSIEPTLAERGPRHWAVVAAGSLIAHLFILMGGVGIMKLPGPTPVLLQPIDLEAKPRSVTRLVAPPLDVLTQKSPNKGKLSQEFNLSSLAPRPEQRNVPASPGAAAAPKKQFTLPER